jgi:hypothetical protein
MSYDYTLNFCNIWTNVQSDYAALGRQSQEDCKFKASLGYIESSRPSWVTSWDPVLWKKPKVIMCCICSGKCKEEHHGTTDVFFLPRRPRQTAFFQELRQHRNVSSSKVGRKTLNHWVFYTNMFQFFFIANQQLLLSHTVGMGTHFPTAPCIWRKSEE